MGIFKDWWAPFSQSGPTGDVWAIGPNGESIRPAEPFKTIERGTPVQRLPGRRPELRSAPSRDAFDAWRDDPVTRFVMAGLKRNAEECKEAWFAESWEAGCADPLKLTAYRERADAVLSLVESNYEAWCETLGVEPERREAEDLEAVYSRAEAAGY